MPQAIVKAATRAVSFNGIILHLDSEERTTLSAKQFKQFTDIDSSRPGAVHMLKGAVVEYVPVKKGDTRDDGSVVEQDGYHVSMITLSDRKGELIFTLATKEAAE